MKESEVKNIVREKYASIARQNQSCCGSKSCCGGDTGVRNVGRNIGYSDEELSAVPEGSNLGLGCGNPVALASLKPGEVVLDLGSGAGFDCFLAAEKVGEKGRVIGVDMTPDMLDKARENARSGSYANVEFRLGEIENLPAADNSVDAIISNCVINLSPDKNRVFQEAFRVLKPGGRVMVSDIILTKALPEEIKNSIAAYVGCIAGASLQSDYLGAIAAAGFTDIRIVEESSSYVDSIAYDPMAQEICQSLGLTAARARELAGTVKSARVQAVKPG